MAKCGYSCGTQGAVALAAATAKSVVGIKSTSDHGVDLTGFRLGFDGVTASAIPVLVELCYSTFATNTPGTNSTSTNIRQKYGRVISFSGVSGATWTAEPTVLTVIEDWLVSPNSSTVLFDIPLGASWDSDVSNGYVIRLTAPAIVNVRASLMFERC